MSGKGLFDVERDRWGREKAVARLHRSTDPEGSRNGAEHAVRSGSAARQREAVLALVQVHPGATVSELERVAADHGIPVRAVSRRLSDLANAGVLRRGEPRRCEVTRIKVTTWWPEGEGRA